MFVFDWHEEDLSYSKLLANVLLFQASLLQIYTIVFC